MPILVENPSMAKKAAKQEDSGRRYGTLIRVTDEFAEAIKRSASFEGSSIADYANRHLLPIVEKRYRDAVLKEARKMEGRDG